MAKQSIGVGATPNDGNGDPLRNAMIKINENFTELYNEQFDGAYTSLTGKPTSLLYWVNDGSAGQVLTTNGAGAITFQDIDYNTALNTSAASNNQILSWTGSDYDWIDQSAGGTSYANADVDIHLNTSTATSSQILSWTGSDYDWVDPPSGGSGGGYTRSSKVGTTAVLADDASENLDITGAKSYFVLEIATDEAAWVRLYTDAASRAADSSRDINTDPQPGDGVIVEVVTAGAETVVISPGSIGFNNETTPTTTIPCRVTNKSGASTAVEVTLKILQLEA